MPIVVRFDPGSTNGQSAIIPAATPLSDGGMSKEQAIALRDLVAAADTESGGETESGGNTPDYGTDVITVYVRSNGSNSTGNGTIDAPYLTPEHAASATRIPLGAILKIDMSGYGTYTPTAPWKLPFILGAQSSLRIRQIDPALPEVSAFTALITYSDLFLYAAPTTRLEIAASSYTAAVDATTGRITYTKTGAGWTVNQWAGMMLVSGTGASTGLSRIVSNTSDTITVTGGTFALTSPSVATPLRIQSESCTIDLVTAGSWLPGVTRERANPFSMTMAGFNFVNGFYAFFQAQFQTLSVFGCSLSFGFAEADGLMTINGCHIRPAGAGLIDVSTPRLDITQSIIRNTSIIVNRGGSLIGTFLDCEGINGFGDGMYHGLTGTQPNIPIVSLGYSEVRNSVGAFRGLNGNWVGSVGFCRFTSCGYGGIRMERGAHCTINGYLAGTGNGASASGAGIVVFDDSQVLIQETSESTVVPLTAANCTIGGTVGDLIVGGNAYRSMASFFGSPPIKLEADPLRAGCRVYQRSAQNQPWNVVSALPTASAAYRAIELTVLGGAGVADTRWVCKKKADDTYGWFEI